MPFSSRCRRLLLTLAHLQQAQGQGHGGFVLAGHMDQIPADDAIGVQHQVVETAAIGRRARHRADGFGHVEDRNEARVGPEAIAQAGLVGADALIAVDVEADRHGPLGAQPVDGFAQHLVVDREPIGSEVGFIDADDRDRFVRAGGSLAQAGDQVIEQQVEGFVDGAALQRQQQQPRRRVGHERADAIPQVVQPQPCQQGTQR